VLVVLPLLLDSTVLTVLCLIISWALLDICYIPLYSYAYLGIHPLLLTVSQFPVMMLSHELATRIAPPLFVI
jgi:hypothetical protein